VSFQYPLYLSYASGHAYYQRLANQTTGSINCVACLCIPGQKLFHTYIKHPFKQLHMDSCKGHVLLEGCDSNFEVKCSKFKSRYTWHNYLALKQYVLGNRLKTIITMTNNLTDMKFEDEFLFW